MDGRGGCCIARYGGGADVAWKVGRIMLKFRPIAPKPAAGGAAPQDVAGAIAKGGRGKRKGGEGVGGGSRRGRKPKKVTGEVAVVVGKQEQVAPAPPTPPPLMVTLPLMPETPERKEDSPPARSPTASDLAMPYLHAAWERRGRDHQGAEVVAPRPVRPAGSWVVVECVTDTWKEGAVWGGAAAGLEGDACPGFLSDVADRVTWTNAAYQRMVIGEEGGEEGEEGGEEVRVALVTRGLVPSPVTCRAFTCRVRVRYACRKRGKVSMAAPCDVWRLADGGLAWRLDVKAALSLGLGS